MLRDKNLVPLSHQHQHALALCVRIGRALVEGTRDLAYWQDEIVRQFRDEIACHFAAEEKVLFPAASRIEAVSTLVDELLVEHGLLRQAVQRAEAHQMTSDDLQMFAASLGEHVRKEERQLFEELQRAMSAQEIAALGIELNRFFAGGGMPGAGCRLPPRV